ncbi:MAG TPA: Lrp/AsnC family transcriptional regulator [Thermoanaerobaculia bacterium]|nr:Lrp/AsnC family transcriptional regulator [Thermoanaerobaculia bacterium]
MIDDKDREILKILQQNARTSNAEIARQLGMAPSAILERVRRLEASGVIQGYEARIDPVALGYHLTAFVFVGSNDVTGELKTAERLAEIPEVQEVHHIAGEDCFLLKVRAQDARSLGRMLRERMAAIGPLRTRTTIVLETVRESGQLPLEALAEEVRHDKVHHP